jgi:hypothetical protein
MKVDGLFKMGYNCQVGVDKKNGVIVGVDVNNNSTDFKQLQPMVEKIEKTTNSKLKGKEMGFDAGYYSSDNVEYLESKKITGFLSEGANGNPTKKNYYKTINSRDCKLVKSGDKRILICPGGQKIVKNENSYYGNKTRGNRYSFSTRKSLCKECKYIHDCYANIMKKKQEKKFQIKREYMNSIEARQRLENRLKTKKGKRRLADRASLVEHKFGDIKENRGFRQFYHRGLNKVKNIWTLVCFAYNLRCLAGLQFQ